MHYISAKAKHGNYQKMKPTDISLTNHGPHSTCLRNIGTAAGGGEMKIIEYFKKQSRIMQILDVIFIICLLYNIILMSLGMRFNGAITTLIGIIICVNLVNYFIS